MLISNLKTERILFSQMMTLLTVDTYKLSPFVQNFRLIKLLIILNLTQLKTVQAPTTIKIELELPVPTA